MGRMTSHEPCTRRGWLASIVLAVGLVSVLILVSVTVNPLLGRAVHWRRIDLGAPAAALALVLAFRSRWL